MALATSTKTFMNDEAGMALFSVVWIVLLLSLLAAGILQVTTNAKFLTQTLEKDMRDHLIAESAVEIFMHRYFYNPSSDENFEHFASFEVLDENVDITVVYEKGKFDLNAHDKEYLAAVYGEAGLEENAAIQMAENIIDWRDQDDIPTGSGAEAAQYEDSGLSYGPRNGWFETVGELQYVLGMDADLFRCVVSRFTVYSDIGSRSPSLVHASIHPRATFEWAYDNSWQGLPWVHPDDVDYLQGVSESAVSMSGQSLTLTVTVNNQQSSRFQTVVRFLSAGGTKKDDRYHVLVPLHRTTDRTCNS